MHEAYLELFSKGWFASLVTKGAGNYDNMMHDESMNVDKTRLDRTFACRITVLRDQQQVSWRLGQQRQDE